MSKIVLLAAVTLAAVLTAAPAAPAQGVRASKVPEQPPPKPLPSGDQLFELGKFDGQTYTNEHFGVSLTAPRGWTVISFEAMKAMRESAKDIFKNEKDEKLRLQLQAIVERTTPLFSASKLPPGSTASFNATLLCAAERVPTAVVKTPRDYYTMLLHTQKLSQAIEAEVVEPFKPLKVGAADFGVYTLKLTTPRGVMIQKHAVSIQSPYAFALVYTYTDEADAGVFDEVLASVRAR